MKGGITGRLQEALLRRLEKSLIECRLLSSDFPLHLHLIREALRALVGRPLHKPLAEKALIALSPSFVAKPRSQVSESARAFSKNPAPMGIRPGRPSLYAGASWALPRSPIRCLDVSYTPRGAKRAYGLAI